MDNTDVKRIFADFVVGDKLIIKPNQTVDISCFLGVAGFKDCEPTKQDMLYFDGGIKGYANLIEQGNYS